MAEGSQKLYLVRKDLQRFLGPYTAKQVRDAFRNMECGQQDEVCGHCGSWVPLGNQKSLQKHYPEIATALRSDLVASWGVASPGESTSLSNASALAYGRSRFGLVVRWILVTVILAGLAAALFMLSRPQYFQAAAWFPPTLESVEEAKDLATFNSLIERIIPKISSFDRNELEKWLPHLRRYAFARDGALPGVTQEDLLGQGPGMMKNCTSRHWQKAFSTRAKELLDMGKKGRLGRNNPLRILAWDPHWIRRRPNSAWLDLYNGYTACLKIAQETLKNSETELIKKIPQDMFGSTLSRLQFIANPESPGLSTLGIYGMWSCFERAADFQALFECRETYQDVANRLSKYALLKFGWSFVRILMSKKVDMSDELIETLNQWLPSLEKFRIDPVTGFDYRAELRYVQNFLQLGHDHAKAVARTRAEFPSVLIQSVHPSQTGKN